MKIVKVVFLVLIFSTASNAQTNSKKVETNLKKHEKVVHSNYLNFCHQRVQRKHSLKKAKQICKCALKSILKNGSIHDVKLLSKKSPKRLLEKTDRQKKKNKKLIALSDLEVHSLDDCEKTNH